MLKQVWPEIRSQADQVRSGASLREVARVVSQRLITPHFQPIFTLMPGEVHGYEALSRIVGPTVFGSIEELFCAARSGGMLSALEQLCRERALTTAAQLGVTERLFLNVCPAVLANDHRPGVTAKLLGELGIERSRVVLELTERSLITDYDLFGRVVDHYRRQGYAIAIDDLGDGFAGLKMLAQIEPDYVKLARFLVADIDRAPVRQALVESIVTFCQRVGIEVIAEGIERQEELDYLTAIGIGLGQGYLLGRPSPQLVEVLPQQLHEQGVPLQGQLAW
ncbi:MAG: EAL domain-containing protein [Geobacter sp.]